MADQILYSVSSKSEGGLDQPFLKKDLVYVNDNASGSTYNGQIIIETSAIANSGRWASYNEGFLTIPYVVALKCSADLTAAPPSLQIGFKNGWWNIIHSISVDYNSSNVCQLVPYLNAYCSYRALTSWAQDDVVKYGGLCNFFKDTASSVSYCPAAAADNLDGRGMCNNRIFPPVLSSARNALNTPLLMNSSFGIGAYNDGYLRRVLNINNVYSAQVNAAGFNPLLYSAARMTDLGIGTFSYLGAGANAVYFMQAVAVIRLKDLHDFFDKIPLLKGAYLKFIINYNAGQFNYAFEANNPPTFLTDAGISYTQRYGATIPYMTTSHQALQNTPSVNALNAATMAMDSAVRSLTFQGQSVDIGVNCRLYVPLYTMAPEYEKNYVSMSPSKEIVYKDVYNYNISNITAGQTLNQLLTNGISSPKALIIIPFINGAAGANVNGAVALPVIQSAFATEPATPSACGALYNLNIQVSGVNIFQSNELYDYEQFSSELSKINAVNGGQTTGLTSGLIGRDDFQRLYRYYVVDLSRGYKADDYVPKSILLTGTVVSTKSMDLFCFIEYERKLLVDVLTGTVIKV